MLLTIIVFIAVLGVLVLVHEWGHFITAKRAGLQVEEFGFGFPPRLLSINRGGTRYSLNLIPFGGFVKILGEGGEEKNNPKSFAARGVGVRALIVAAGILMNLLLALVLFSITNSVGVRTAYDESIALPSYAQVGAPEVTITAVESEGPADQAGLRAGDLITSVADQPVSSVAQTVQAVEEYSGQTVLVTVKRGDQTLTHELTPRVEPPDGQGPIGIQLFTTAVVRYPWYMAPYEAAKQIVLLTGRIVVTFGQIIGQLVRTGDVGADVAGPVGIAVLTGQFIDLGLVPLLQFIGLLSVNLAIINAVPFPALDGGRLLFLVVEKIRGKHISKRVENMLHTVGFGLLIALILFITVKDVLRLL